MQRYVKIIGIASPICWWVNCIGQVCLVLDVYKPTGFIKIRVSMPTTSNGIDYDENYELDGWIDSKYVEYQSHLKLVKG